VTASFSRSALLHGVS